VCVFLNNIPAHVIIQGTKPEWCNGSNSVCYVFVACCYQDFHNTVNIKHKFQGKSLLYPPTMGVDYLTPSTIKRSILPPELSKIGQITPQGKSDFVFFFFIYFG
jgi:hypothetical protein